MMGAVYLIGAGPGDPDLITRRGMNCLRDSQAVLVDALAPEELVEELDGSVEVYDVGKRAGRHSRDQSDINELILRLAREGKNVARLHGGDPMIFGRGGEEVRFLREHGVEVEVVPGVTAASAVSAELKVPLTDRDLASEVTLLTGHEAPDKDADRLDWHCMADCRKTLVVYMGRNRLREICEVLIEYGRPPETPVAVVSAATTEDQQTVTGDLRTIADRCERAELSTPATTVIGEVTGLAPGRNSAEGSRRTIKETAEPPQPTPYFLTDWAFQTGLL